MFVEAVPEQARRNLAVLAQAGVTQPFYLAGGTAAALHLGHRISVDLDFFGPEPFDSEELAGRLTDLGRFRLERFAPDTLLGSFEDVRISFFRYRYSLVDEPVTVLGTLAMGLGDLAAMKVEAIGEDAEADPMSQMLRPVSWPDVRRFFELEAQTLLRQL